MLTFYIIGVLISFIIGITLMLKENNKNGQYGMIAVMALLSWISVILFVVGKIQER